MNLFLHGIGGHAEDQLPVKVSDSLLTEASIFFDMVLANFPFGGKSSITFSIAKVKSNNEANTVIREDFWTNTSNKQLNVIHHIYFMLKVNGRAADIVGDNILFEGGAGKTIRKNLLETCDVHTLLCLPARLN